MISKELKQKWIDALRSGKYEQGQQMLRTADNKFCCLGVLCDIENPDGWNPMNEWLDEGAEVRKTGLEEEIVTKNCSCGEADCVISKSIFDVLTEMNDSENKSFPEIADWIETNVPTES